jgi:hypothetical protein
VADHLADPRTIGHRGERGRERSIDRHVRIAGPDLVHDRLDRRHEVERLDLQGQASPFGFGDRQQAVDDAHELVERLIELAQELAAFGLRHVAFRDDVGDPLRDRHRRPKLVGDVRQELGLGAGHAVELAGAQGERVLKLQLVEPGSSLSP